MSARAPEAVWALWYEIKKQVPSAVLSGIVGDVRHSFGYHLARRDLSSSDYSVVLPRDKMGAGDCASALDVSLSPALMKAVTSRLFVAARAGDARLYALREFCGTLNGDTTAAYDLHSKSASYGTWDSSHLWHVHLSFFRAYADSTSALLPIANVIGGAAAPRPAPKPAPNAPAWPLPSREYFGLISGPSASHGGKYASERPAIKRIQQRLQALGFAPKTPTWADGIFGPQTAAAVTHWQRARYAKLTTRYGEVWADDWHRLFS